MTDRDKFEAWWFAAPEGGASYEQVYGRSYREVAYLAWMMAAEEAVRRERERLALPKSYGGNTLGSWGDHREGCTVRIHFTDATEAEQWFNRMTDQWDRSRNP